MIQVGFLQLEAIRICLAPLSPAETQCNFRLKTLLMTLKYIAEETSQI